MFAIRRKNTDGEYRYVRRPKNSSADAAEVDPYECWTGANGPILLFRTCLGAEQFRHLNNIVGQVVEVRWVLKWIGKGTSSGYVVGLDSEIVKFRSDAKHYDRREDVPPICRFARYNAADGYGYKIVRVVRKVRT